jgi:hypothetical protein
MYPITPPQKALFIYPQKYLTGTTEILGKKNGYRGKKILGPSSRGYKRNSVFFQDNFIRVGSGDKGVPERIGGYHPDQHKKLAVIVRDNHIQRKPKNKNTKYSRQNNSDKINLGIKNVLFTHTIS